VYNSSGEVYKGKEYAEVVDESMMIGSEKLLMTLAVPAKHSGAPINHADVSLLRMGVSESWKGETVKDELEKGAQKVGHPPKYVISDNASIMNKGIRLLGIPQHCDISHSLGMLLERTYKDAPDFKAYLKSMSEVKFKLNMKKIAYLLPPAQRAISRFINLSDWVEWSDKVLEVYHTLNSEEKSAFSFVPANASFIKELQEVMECVGSIEHICKHQGLSVASILLCHAQVKRMLACGNSRMVTLAQEIYHFLEAQAAMLESDTEERNNSSDIIESIFGTYKLRKSPNKLHGVTSFVLFLPAYLQIQKEKKTGKFHFKESLERIRLKEIEHWSRENLSENLVRKRTQTLKKAA
jgi:hypothetical protein